jgi:hypothetical protein
MSSVREVDDEENAIELEGEELEEVEAAIAEADANPGAGIELGELMRRIRNGE